MQNLIFHMKYFSFLQDIKTYYFKYALISCKYTSRLLCVLKFYRLHIYSREFLTISLFVLFVDSNSLVYMYVINRFCVTWLNVSAKQINLLYCCTQRKSNRSHYTGLVHEMYIQHFSERDGG